MSATSPSDDALSSRATAIFIGPYGTGKTEVAINYSLASVRAGRRTCLVDLDVVTPYFRVGDHRDGLGDSGLRVIAAEGALAHTDSPSLSPEIGGALADGELHVVLDVGGDPEGARLLRVYAAQISRRDYDMWLVVNPYRPGSSRGGVETQRREIEQATGLKVSGLAANPNIGPLTECADIERGFETVADTGRAMALPIVLVAVAERLVASLGQIGAPVLPLRLLLRPPWEDS